MIYHIAKCNDLLNMYRFRWAACQLEELKRCTRRQKTLKYILESLPETLEATYDQILSRITPADASDAAKLLLWLAFAKKPLHVDCLAIVVEFDVSSEDFDPIAKLSSSEDVLRICSSLVAKMSDNTVQLAHASVKEYVQGKPRVIQSNITINPSQGNIFVGKCCLAYLLCSTESVPICQNYKYGQTYHERNTHKRFDQSLIRYAAKFWPKHISESKQEPCFSNQIKKLFIFGGFSFHNWVEIYNYDCPYNLKMDRHSSLLECASFHGLTSMVGWLLPNVVNNTEVLDASYVSLNNGHVAMANVLIEKVIDLGGCGRPVGNVLYAASSGGHGDIIKLMLEKGANVNAQGNHGNALQGACHRGYKEIAELLIRAGADVNSGGKAYKSVLQAAAYGGNKDIIELLLETGANVKEQGGYALQAASAGGHKQVVELLLTRGADVNMHENCFQSALEVASYGGYKDIVELLISIGSKVNVQEKYGKALWNASCMGHRDIAELLLESGAHVVHVTINTLYSADVPIPRMFSSHLVL